MQNGFFLKFMVNQVTNVNLSSLLLKPIYHVYVMEYSLGNKGKTMFLGGIALTDRLDSCFAPNSSGLRRPLNCVVFL